MPINKAEAHKRKSTDFDINTFVFIGAGTDSNRRGTYRDGDNSHSLLVSEFDLESERPPSASTGTGERAGAGAQKERLKAPRGSWGETTHEKMVISNKKYHGKQITS